MNVIGVVGRPFTSTKSDVNVFLTTSHVAVAVNVAVNDHADDHETTTITLTKN